MNISRKTIISSACGVVLTTGLIIVLVLITGAFISYFPLSIQKNIPSFIFIFSLLAVAPLIARRLNRLDDMKKILGWTFIGTGAEFIAFPVSLLFVIKSMSSLGVLLVTAMTITYLFIFGIPAGLISITIGIFLIKHRKFSLSV